MNNFIEAEYRKIGSWHHCEKVIILDFIAIGVSECAIILFQNGEIDSCSLKNLIIKDVSKYGLSEEIK